LSRCYAAHAID